jgi:hypothetical protein
MSQYCSHPTTQLMAECMTNYHISHKRNHCVPLLQKIVSHYFLQLHCKILQFQTFSTYMQNIYECVKTEDNFSTNIAVSDFQLSHKQTTAPNSLTFFPTLLPHHLLHRIRPSELAFAPRGKQIRHYFIHINRVHAPSRTKSERIFFLPFRSILLSNRP